MKAEYGSQADALSIDLIDADKWDGSVVIDDDCCVVATIDGSPANVELLYPGERLDVLRAAAERFQLDHEALLVAAKSALAAPDRPVLIDLLARAAG